MAADPTGGDWAQRAAAALVAAGHRRGGARAAVIELLAAEHCALSAVEIEDRLRRGPGRPVARASVYRILEELERAGQLTRVEVGQGLARFEADHGEHHHHHLVCDGCGAMEPFADAPLERAIAALAARVEYEVDRHDVVLHGRCPDCR